MRVKEWEIEVEEFVSKLMPSRDAIYVEFKGYVTSNDKSPKPMCILIERDQYIPGEFKGMAVEEIKLHNGKTLIRTDDTRILREHEINALKNRCYTVEMIVATDDMVVTKVDDSCTVCVCGSKILSTGECSNLNCSKFEYLKTIYLFRKNHNNSKLLHIKDNPKIDRLFEILIEELRGLFTDFQVNRLPHNNVLLGTGCTNALYSKKFFEIFYKHVNNLNIRVQELDMPVIPEDVRVALNIRYGIRNM